MRSVNANAHGFDRPFTSARLFCKKEKSQTVEIIEIPFDPNGSNEWAISIPGNGEERFTSREGAIAFAFKVVNTEKSANREAFFCVEGGDHRWRLFTADLLPARRSLPL